MTRTEKYKMNYSQIKKRSNSEKWDRNYLTKKTNKHAGCWKAVRDPFSKKLLRIMDPSGKSYTIIPTYNGGKLDFFHWDDFKAQHDNAHPDCWNAVRNPITNDVTGVIDSFGYIYNIEQDNAELVIENRGPKVEVLSFNDLEEAWIGADDLEEDYQQRGTLVWDLDWGKVTTDPKELTYIYVWCTKAINDLATYQYEISTGTKWLEKPSGSTHNNGRKVFYMNRPMREASSILQRFALGGVEVDHSVCKVTLGEWPNERPIQVNHCVVADSSLPLSLPTQSQNKDCDTSSPTNALIELTVQSKIDSGDSVTVDINLELIRDILETGECPNNVHGSFKPLNGVAGMNDESMSFSPLPSQHHLKRYENHVSDINCQIIGLAMDVEDSYDLKDEFGYTDASETW